MSDATFHGPIHKVQADTVHLPKPEPFGAPVLITDCTTPLGGETVLSLILKRLAQSDQP